MGKFDDFDLDVTKTAAQGGIEPKYKSKAFKIFSALLLQHDPTGIHYPSVVSFQSSQVP